MRNRILYTLLLCGVIVIPHSGCAQNEDSLRKKRKSDSTAEELLNADYWHIKNNDAWLKSHNAASLTRLTFNHVSNANITIVNEDGAFTPYYRAPKSFTLQADVEAYYRLNDKMSLFGHMAYYNISDRHAAASALFSPQHMPFDIVEDSLTNTGRKHTDTYHLVGAVGYDIYQGIAIGAKADFLAANYAKYKDLRHKNNILDFTLTAGIYAPVGRHVRLGTHLGYRRNIESLRFMTYGNSDKVYQSLISYGIFTGHVEQFGEQGYTDQNSEMPLLSEHFGGGVQAELSINDNITLYNELDFACRKGYYGKKSTYSVSFSQHNGHEYHYRGRLTWHMTGLTQRLTAEAKIENLTNYSNSYRSKTDAATGASSYEYFTPLKVSDKVWTDISVIYEALLGGNTTQPLWELTAGWQLQRIKQTVYVYPYMRRQNLRCVEWKASAARRIPVGKVFFTPCIQLSYGKGSGQPYTDGTLATPSDKQSPPPEMTTYLWRDYLYTIAPHWQAMLSAKYSFHIPPTKMMAYVEGAFSFAKANTRNININDRNRRTLRLTLGCNF